MIYISVPEPSPLLPPYEAREEAPDIHEFHFGPMFLPEVSGFQVSVVAGFNSVSSVLTSASIV